MIRGKIYPQSTNEALFAPSPFLETQTVSDSTPPLKHSPPLFSPAPAPPALPWRPAASPFPAGHTRAGPGPRHRARSRMAGHLSRLCVGGARADVRTGTGDFWRHAIIGGRLIGQLALNKTPRQLVFPTKARKFVTLLTFTRISNCYYPGLPILAPPLTHLPDSW